MSVKTRHTERLEFLAVFIQQLAQMDKEMARMALEWSLCVGILFLVYEGDVGATAGMLPVTIIMGIDLARVYEIYKGVKTGRLNVTEADD